MSNWQQRQSLLGSFDNPAGDKIKKQQYLIDNIVNAGYDKQEFALYMGDCKKNGTDIDEWTLIELMDMVDDFKREHSPSQNINNEDSDSDKDPREDNHIVDNSTDDERFNSLPSKEHRGSIEDEKLIEQEAIEEAGLAKETVQTVNTKIARTELSYLKKSQIKVVVSDGLVKKSGLFSFSYASYKVQTEPLGYLVRRKEEDFVMLRKYLCKIYPNMYIPPLILTSKKLTEKAILKKEKYFTKFLVNVLRNKDLRGCEYLHDFLYIKDDKDFKAKRKLREKEKEPMSVFDHYTSSGIADVRGNSNIWRFSYQMPEFTMNYTGINKNIQEVTKQFVEQSEELSKTVFQLAKYYECLGEMYKGIEVKNMFQIHKFMSDIFTCWGNTYVDQANIMGNKFGKFFTYHTYEDGPLRELIKHRFHIKESYVKAEIKLSDKKARLLKSQDYKKWELEKEGLNRLSELQKNEDLAKQFMLPKETKSVEDKRYLLNYISNQVNSQVRGMFDNNYTDLCEHLMEIGVDHKEVTTQ